MISDELNEPDKFVFGSGTVEGGAHVLVYGVGGSTNRSTPPYQASFRLSDGQDSIYLFAPDSSLQQAWFAPCIPSDRSFGQSQLQADPVLFRTPTPGAPNSLDTLRIQLIQDQLVSSQSSGFYTQAIEVSLQATDPRTSIFYSLNGDEVDPDELAYSTPLRLGNKKNAKDKIADEPTSPLWKEPEGPVFKAQVLRARGYYQGCPTTEEVFRTFFIDPYMLERYRVPVFSLISDRDNFFDYDEGIYVPGVNFNPADDGYSGNYFETGRAWEREINLEIFAPNGTLQLEQTVGGRINGNTTRSYPQKSLRLYARPEYSGTSTIPYRFFLDRSFTEYETIVLRTAGADISNTFFKDALCHQLATQLRVDYQSASASVVFLNGEYWGIHNIRERQDEFYLKRLYGVIPGEYDLISVNDFTSRLYEVDQGDLQAYQSLLAYVRAHDLSQDKYMDTLYTLIDFDNFIDYHILQLFVANEDWLNANTKFWRERNADGKWRWLFFDCDRCFTNIDNDRLGVLTGNRLTSSWADWAIELQQAVFRNEKFRDRFHARFVYAMENVFTTGNLLRIIDDMERIYEPLANEQIERWRFPESFYNWKDNVNGLRSFAMYRPVEMMRQLTDNFGIPYIVAPNPASASAPIRIMMRDQTIRTVQLRVFDAQGRVVQDAHTYTTGTPIATRGLLPGYYVAHVTTGELVFRLPLIVTR